MHRLNALTGRLELPGGSCAEVLGWNHALHLCDNVPHRHTYFEICLVGAQGAGEFRVEDQAHAIESGDCFFARPGVVHQIVNTQTPGMELWWVSFGIRSGEGEVGALWRAFEASDVLVKRDASVIALWRALATLGDAPFQAGSEATIRALASALLLAIAGAGIDAASETALPIETGETERDARRRQARLALQYVHDNLDRKLSLAEIANHVHVSPRQLSRLFASFAGISPAAYIERVRLDRAERLLLRTAQPIKTIACEVGYPDVAHFSRAFARRCGNPPGDFRKRGGPLHQRADGPDIQKPGELV